MNFSFVELFAASVTISLPSISLYSFSSFVLTDILSQKLPCWTRLSADTCLCGELWFFSTRTLWTCFAAFCVYSKLEAVFMIGRCVMLLVSLHRLRYRWINLKQESLTRWDKYEWDSRILFCNIFLYYTYFMKQNVQRILQNFYNDRE